MADAIKAATNKEFVDSFSKKALLKTSETVFKRTFASIDGTTGELENADASQGKRPVGYFASEARQLDDKNVGDGEIKWVAHGEKTLLSVAVTGLTSVAQEGVPVWATDSATLTVVAQAGPACGHIVDFVSAGVGNVYFYSFNEIIKIGQKVETILLTKIESIQLEGTSKITLAKLLSNFKGSIVSISVVTSFEDTGVVAGAQTISLEVGSTPVVVTGGVVSLAFGNTQGLRINGTAITALNTVNYGEEIALILDAGGTGFTTAKRRMYDVYLDIVRGA